MVTTGDSPDMCRFTPEGSPSAQAPEQDDSEHIEIDFYFLDTNGNW